MAKVIDKRMTVEIEGEFVGNVLGVNLADETFATWFPQNIFPEHQDTR